MIGVAEIKVPSEHKNLNRLIDFIVGFAEKQGFDRQRIWEIELVVDEVLTNIIDYAYPYRQGNIEVRCRYDSRQGLTMEIRDNGIPFNPLSYSAEEPEKAPNNGFGIILMRRLIDHIIYERAAGKNCLTLIKRSCVIKKPVMDSAEPARAET